MKKKMGIVILGLLFLAPVAYANSSEIRAKISIPLRLLTEQLNGRVNYHSKEDLITMTMLHGPSLPEEYPASLAEKSGDVVYIGLESSVIRMKGIRL